MNFFHLAKLQTRIRMVAEDAEADAKSLDGKPFTALTVGGTFGNVFASIKALATTLDSVIEEMKREHS